MGKKPIVSVTHENERISIKKQLTLHKMCVTSLLCGPRADLWPFHGFLCKRFSLYINLYIERQILIFGMLRNNADAHISRLGYLWANKPFIPCFTIMVKIAFTIILSKNLNIMTCLISSQTNTLSEAKIKHYIDILKQKYITYWQHAIHHSKKLQFYCLFKDRIIKFQVIQT